MVLSRLVLTGTLLLVLGLGVVSTTGLIWNTFRNGAPPLPAAADVIGGRVTSGIAKDFSRDVPVRPIAINLLNATAYYIFGEARHGALIGSDDWLFSREEFQRTAQSSSNINAALSLT